MKNRGEAATDRAQSVLLVGYGYAGKRFKKALDFLQQKEPGLARLVGIVDSQRSKIGDDFTQAGQFTDLQLALDQLRPDVAIVCVNEQDHYSVLRRIADSGVASIVCEKPLTSSLEEAVALSPALSGRFFSMNMVERFSPIVGDCVRWLDEHPDLTTGRIEFFWGKHRVRDPRPTMGVCSEVIHPIDLIRLVFKQPKLKLERAFSLECDLGVSAESCLDSVFAMFQGADCSVVGQASFAWPTRDRRIVAYHGGKGKLFRLTMEFDLPRWDCDAFRVVSVDVATGVWELVHEFVTSNADFPPELDQVYKVKQFLHSSLRASAKETSAVPLVSYDEAVELQRILASLDEEIHRGSCGLTRKPFECV